MAAQDATDSQIKSLERTMLLDGLHGILRAGRGEATRRPYQWGDETLIKVDGQQEQPSEKVKQGFHLPWVCGIRKVGG